MFAGLRLYAYGAALLVVLGALWWAYSTVWQRGYDVADAEGKAALATLLTQIEAERQRTMADARATEEADAAAQRAISEAYERGKTDAQAIADAVTQNLRTDNDRLRRHWRGCENATARVPATPAAGPEPDGDAELRARDTGYLVGLGARADRQIAGLQAALRVCAQGPVKPPPRT